MHTRSFEKTPARVPTQPGLVIVYEEDNLKVSITHMGVFFAVCWSLCFSVYREACEKVQLLAKLILSA